MKAAVLHGQKDLRVEEIDKPVIDAGEVLVRVKATGICGSDIPPEFLEAQPTIFQMFLDMSSLVLLTQLEKV